MVTDMAPLSGPSAATQVRRLSCLVPLLALVSCGDGAEPPLRVFSDLGPAATERIAGQLDREVEVTEQDAAEVVIRRGPAVDLDGSLQATGYIVLVTRADDDSRPTGFAHAVARPFRDRVVIPDPATCPAGFVLLAAVSSHYGWGWFERLRVNGASVLRDQEAVIAAVLSRRADVGVVALGAVTGTELAVIYPDDGAIAHPILVSGTDGGLTSAVLKAAREVTASAVPTTYPFAEAAQRSALRRRDKLLRQFQQVMRP